MSQYEAPTGAITNTLMGVSQAQPSAEQLQERIANLLEILARREERIAMLEERLAAAREYMMWPHTQVQLTEESKR